MKLPCRPFDGERPHPRIAGNYARSGTIKKLASLILAVAWLLVATIPPVVSVTEVPGTPLAECPVVGVQEEEQCDEYDLDFDFDITEEGDIEINILFCELKEKRTTITTVVVETDEGTEITTGTVVECDYGACGVEEL